MKTKYIFICLLFFIGFSCEDVIQLESKSGEKQITIVGFLDDSYNEQSVDITYSKPYNSDNDFEPITNAEVKVNNITKSITYNFIYNTDDKTYNWDNSLKKLGDVGDSLTLEVKIDNNEYFSSSKILKTTKIDSITYRKLEKFEIDDNDKDNDYRVEVFAKDIPNELNFWWIRFIINNKESKIPEDISIGSNRIPSKDTDGFTDASKSITEEGKLFIEPLREIGDFEKNSIISASIWSINEEMFDFLNNLSKRNSNQGLFAPVVSNLNTNIYHKDKSLSTKAIGWFSVSSSSKIKTIKIN